MSYQIGACAALSATLLGASLGWAQTGQESEQNTEVEASEPQSSPPPSVDEITITGTKSDVTDIQSESQAISAFSMEELDRANIVNVDQLAFNVPALHVGQLGSQSIITLRGIGTENASITGEPGVAFHVDGVSYGRPAAARVAFFDLEGVQVLRGPQGTQGGKNATAGWIHAITRKPTGEFSAEGDVQWGNYGQRRLRGALNIPLSEFVQTRFAFFREDRDGYQRNLLFKDDDRDAFDADEFGWRSHLRFQLREDLDALFTYNYYEMKGVGFVAEIVGLPPERRCNPFPPGPPFFGTGYNPLTHLPPFAGCAANPNRVIALGGIGLNPDCNVLECIPDPLYAATGFDLNLGGRFGGFENPATRGESRARAIRASRTPHEIYLDQPSGNDHKFWGWTQTLTWEPPELPGLGATELQGILSYQVTNLDTSQDADATDLALFIGDSLEDTDQWSGELRWSGSSLHERLDWQASALLINEKSDSKARFLIDLGFLDLVSIDQSTDNTSYGLALSTRWHTADRFSVSLGGRYIKDQKRTAMLRDNPPASAESFGAQLAVCDGGATDLKGTPLPRPGNPDFETGDGHPDDGIPTCERTFRQLTGDLTLEWWAREDNLLYAKAANGFKAGGFSQGQFDLYDPEYIWSFALGSKNQFFDNRLTLNLEAYFYNYRDLQLVLVDGLARRTDNADAEIMGVDLEFQAEPFPGLRLNGVAAWTDSELTDYVEVDPLDVLIAGNCRQRDLGLDVQGCARTDWSGNTLPRAPEWTFTIGAEYEFFLGRFGTLTPRVQYYWQDETWFRPFNRTFANSGPNAPCPPELLRAGIVACNPQTGLLLNASDGRDLQPSYHHTDLKLVWQSPSERWSAEAFVKNLEDELVYQNVLVGSALLDSPQLAWYGAPRIYGFRIGFRY